MHTFIPTFYTNTTWFFICASDPQLIQVKFQIQMQVLGALASMLHRIDENPHFHQFKHTEISFTSVVSSVGWVLWFCYKLHSAGFLKLNEPSVLGVLYKSLSEWNNCQLPVFLKFCEEPAKDLWWRKVGSFSTGSLIFQELHRSRLHMRDPYPLVPSLEKRELHWVMSECLFLKPLLDGHSHKYGKGSERRQWTYLDHEAWRARVLMANP